MVTKKVLQTVDWEQYAIDYDLLLQLGPYQKLLESVICATDIRPHNRILDAGCGTGNIIMKLEQLSIPISLLGIDRSETMLYRAKSKCVSELEFADLDMDLKYSSNSFDRIICSNALYPVKDPLFTLNEFFRVLRPGGRIVIANPKVNYENGLILKEHAGSTKSDHYWSDLHSSTEREESLVYEAIDNTDLADAMLSIARVNRCITHAKYHFFSRKELCSIVKDAGFRVIKVESVYAKQNYLITATKGAML